MVTRRVIAMEADGDNQDEIVIVFTDNNVTGAGSDTTTANHNGANQDPPQAREVVAPPPREPAQSQPIPVAVTEAPFPPRDALRIGYLDDDHRPPSPGTIEVLQRLGSERPTAFAEAAPATYADFVSSRGQPVYGIPVLCQMPPPPPPPAFAVVTPLQPQINGPTETSALQRIQQAMHEESFELVWSQSRSVRIYAVADTFIVCLLVLSRYWVAALLPFPILGFIGARKYYRWMITAYLAYFPVILVLRGYVGYANATTETSNSMMIVVILLSVLGGLAELYIAFCVFRLFRTLKNVSEAALQTLREGWVPDGVSWSI